MAAWKAIRVWRRFRLAGSRTLVVAATFFLLIPHFACQCANGQVMLFCLPGHCGAMCAGASCGEGRVCCQKKHCCHQAKGSSGSKKPSHTVPSASRHPCCTLVWEAQTPVTVPAVADVDTAPTMAIWVLHQPIDLAGVERQPCQHVPLDPCPPPIDLVIAQLRLTI